jgi:miniconductance mechanosensitive channel
MQKTVLSDLVIEGFAEFGIELTQQSWMYQSSIIVLLLVTAWLSYTLTRIVFNGRMTKMVLSSNNTWDDELHKHRFFRRCGHIIPAILIYLLSYLLLTPEQPLLAIIQKTMIVYILIATVAAGSALFNTIEDIYNASELAKRASITGFIQVGKLVMVIVASLLVIASLLDRSPLLLLSGLGAVTAILLLIFRDTILGFVAGIQIAANRMVNTGDWIEMDKYGADGDVLQVGLTTVKVQNWDKTITTIPTYALITEPVKNWRGMTESGGRRIKRAINIDIQSIRFCDEETLEQYKKIRYISEYIDSKKKELALFRQEQDIDEQDLVNSRRLTNIGTLRAYMKAYLANHPKLNKELTMMVRQLPPTELGVPLEVYCFSAEKNWIKYEAIQADIFDHLLAMLAIFDLRAYQRISDSK